MLEYFAELGGWSFVLTTLITGLFVVFLALALLIGFVYLFGLIFSQKKNKPTAVKPEAGTKQPAMTVEDGVSDEVVAVIAAAIAAMSGDGKSYAIRSIKKAKKSGRPAWATAGIMENTRAF